MNADLLDTLIQRELPAAQGGDTKAYARLVAATQRMVASIALAVTRDVAASEDIAQETFLAAWQRIGQMRNPASFLPWLRQVARNRALDHVRARRYREMPIDPIDVISALAAEPRNGPAETLADAQDAALIAQALDEIPEESREVLLLFYREGERTRDVAALLGLSDAAVRKRLQRGRESLRAELLRRFAEDVDATAPSAAFTGAVTAALAMASTGKAAAAGAAGSIAAKAALGVLGAVLASAALMVGAVAFEVRYYLSRARNAAERRAIIHNGVVYAALMATYAVVLAWAARAHWSAWAVMGSAVAFSFAIIGLAYERCRARRALLSGSAHSE